MTSTTRSPRSWPATPGPGSLRLGGDIVRRLSVAALVVAALIALASARAHADPALRRPGDALQLGELFHPHAASTVARRLDATVREIQQRVARGEKPIVIFDLDDTLLLGAMDYRDARAFQGSRDLVRRFVDAGAHIAYVSGRPTFMKWGTTAQLRALGFPIGGDHRLYLRHAQRSVVASKRVHATRLSRRGPVVAAFENEAPNTRMFRAALPHAHIFHHATRSDAADPTRALGRRGITVFHGFPGHAGVMKPERRPTGAAALRLPSFGQMRAARR